MNLSSRIDGGLFHQTRIVGGIVPCPTFSVFDLCAEETFRFRTNVARPYTSQFYSGKSFPLVRIDRDRTGRQDDNTDEVDLYEVRIIDNDYNTYQEVMEITMVALGITQAQAYAVACEVDHRGSCAVAHGPREDAELIAGIIRTIGIEVQVNPATRLTSC